jgi:hypothetical protein
MPPEVLRDSYGVDGWHMQVRFKVCGDGNAKVTVASDTYPGRASGCTWASGTKNMESRPLSGLRPKWGASRQLGLGLGGVHRAGAEQPT